MTTEPDATAAGDEALVAAAELPGVPDEFQRLWTPHRMAYISAGREPMELNCPFCAAPGKSDEDGLIVARGKSAYVLLNLFSTTRDTCSSARTATSPRTTRRPTKRSPKSGP